MAFSLYFSQVISDCLIWLFSGQSQKIHKKMSALDYFSDNNNVLKEMPYVKIQIPKRTAIRSWRLKSASKGNRCEI